MVKSRQISISVPADFSIPALYMEGSTEKIALALTLGSEAVSYIQKHAMDAVREESHDEAIREATKEFERSSGAISIKLKKAEEAARSANLRIEAMEADAASLRSQIQKEVTASFRVVLDSKDQQITHAKEALEKAMETVGRKVESLQNSMTKTFSSSKEKGALGEYIIEDFLKKAYDCTVHIVSKEAQTADIRMCRGTTPYFWEVKNYSRMVTTDEVEKFRRDLRLHPDVRGGILVSMREGIVGKSRGGDIDVEFLEDGRFILYISKFMSHDDPVFYLQTLRPFFDTIEAMAKPVKEDTDAIRALEMKANLMTNLLRSHAQSVTRHKNSLVGHKKRTDAMFTEFQGYILEAEAQLQTVLRVAMGGDDASAKVQAEAATLLPPTLFNKECLSDYADDKEREFIKWILAQVEVREGCQVEIKDIVEKGKSQQFSEKFIRGLRETLFTEGAWPKGSRTVVGMRLL